MGKNKIIPGKLISKHIYEQIRLNLESSASKPKLAIVMLSDDQASDNWIAKKHSIAKELGMESEIHRFDANTTVSDAVNFIADLNTDPRVTGILIQLPLYTHLEAARETILNSVDPRKDVDGLNPTNQGLLAFGYEPLISATAMACYEAISYSLASDQYQPGSLIDLSKKHIVIVNHSVLVGRPLAQLLLNSNATVTICHEHTKEIRTITSQADILVTATGQIGLITADHIKENSTVIDVTSIPTEGGFKGDAVIDDKFEEKVNMYTPVPGGIGPITIACLMRNLANTIS